MAAPEMPHLDSQRWPGALSESAPGHGAADLEAPDEALVAQVRAGDRSAFDALYDRYFLRIHQFLDRRLRNRADTEETVQEVFINIFCSIDGFRGEAPFGAWVFGLTRRTLAARFKRKRHATVPLLDDETETVDLLLTTVRREPDPLETYEAAERLGRFERALEFDLTHEQRQLFQLHHLENVSIHEIARRLNKSEDAVKSNLYRARKLLLAR